MPQFQLRMLAGREEAERIGGLLEHALDDEEDTSVSWFEMPEGWAVDVLMFADTPADAEARVRDMLGSDAFGAPIDVAPVPDLDWVKLSLEGLQPVRAGRFTVHGAHDRARVAAGSIGIEIEANQAFGTGHHPTTAGCLVALTDLLKRYSFESVLDLGTGSGVLAIAYAKAARRPVLASDIDPVATAIAAENARLNGVGGLVDAVTAEGFGHPALAGGRFDLVLANILAGPLVALAPKVRAVTVAPARLILSGILAEQAAGVDAAYRAQGFFRERAILREGWATLVLAKRG
jgi:ribosomal protein L11 methyltransferase